MKSVLPVSEVWSWLIDLAAAYWYLGLFAASFFGSLVVFVPIPYYLLVASISLVFDPGEVTLISATAATLAKATIFRLSYEGRRFLGEKTRRRLRPFELLVGRYGWLAAFLAAATPVPDDLIYVPLGLARYDLRRFLPATLAGKVILTGIVAYGSRFSVEWVMLLIEQTRDPIGAALSVVGVLLGIALSIFAVLRLDWGKLLVRWFPWTAEEEPSSTETSKQAD